MYIIQMFNHFTGLLTCRSGILDKVLVCKRMAHGQMYISQRHA